jgi:hypothetical protein
MVTIKISLFPDNFMECEIIHYPNETHYIQGHPN